MIFHYMLMDLGSTVRSIIGWYSKTVRTYPSPEIHEVQVDLRYTLPWAVVRSLVTPVDCANLYLNLSSLNG